MGFNFEKFLFMHLAKYPFLSKFGISEVNKGVFDGKNWCGSGKAYTTVSPTMNHNVLQVTSPNAQEYESMINNMLAAKEAWSMMPVPQRGEIVRALGEEFRKYKVELGSIISLEMGKIQKEGEGEVQEVIDMCDFACGLSRQLNGKVIPSERKEHALLEQWNPLGCIGVITAFNFPFAVFGWNLCLSMICGNCTMWKGGESAGAITLAVSKIVANVLKQHKAPEGIFTSCIGSGQDVGERMLNDKRLNLISFTGSTKIGQHVAKTVAGRFGKCLLELGGNNCSIIMEDADIEMAVKGCIFGAVGTAGQRCTTLRRLAIHHSKYDEVVKSLLAAYPNIPIGDPLVDGTLLGPLHNKRAIDAYLNTVAVCKKQGGKVLYGGEIVTNKGPGNYVLPTIVEIDPHAPIVQEETFAPILYVFRIKDLGEAIRINNMVPQGLSSSIYTKNLEYTFRWIGPQGSDCGLVNVNIGTSGAEIGGAFGGEKETGGGRESGSDAWKQYMRRATCTINYGKDMPLAQGIKFDTKPKL